MPETVTVSEYMVAGMSCQHCVMAVTEQVRAVAGVTDVTVDLTTGRVSITSDSQLDHAAVRAAIDEAGYEVAD